MPLAAFGFLPPRSCVCPRGAVRPLSPRTFICVFNLDSNLEQMAGASRRTRSSPASSVRGRCPSSLAWRCCALALLTAAFARLLAQGVEPNPGPAPTAAATSSDAAAPAAPPSASSPDASLRNLDGETLVIGGTYRTVPHHCRHAWSALVESALRGLERDPSAAVLVLLQLPAHYLPRPAGHMKRNKRDKLRFSRSQAVRRQPPPLPHRRPLQMKLCRRNVSYATPLSKPAATSRRATTARQCAR